MSAPSTLSVLRSILCGVLVVLGLSVFAVRLLHEGPYPMPRGGNLFGGLSCLLLGAALLWRGMPRAVHGLALAATPVALFPAVFAIAAETEEVVSLYASDRAGTPVELRLWIVDREDGTWLGMAGAKATEHALDGVPHAMLRGGERRCVVPAVVEERATTLAVHALKLEKYAVARTSSRLGLYPSEAPETSVAVRVDPCPAGTPPP